MSFIEFVEFIVRVAYLKQADFAEEVGVDDRGSGAVDD